MSISLLPSIFHAFLGVSLIMDLFNNMRISKTMLESSKTAQGNWRKVHSVEGCPCLAYCWYSAVLPIVLWLPLKFCGGFVFLSAVSDSV